MSWPRSIQPHHFQLKTNIILFFRSNKNYAYSKEMCEFLSFIISYRKTPLLLNNSDLSFIAQCIHSLCTRIQNCLLDLILILRSRNLSASTCLKKGLKICVTLSLMIGVRRSSVVSTPACHFVGPGFKSQPGYPGAKPMRINGAASGH